MPNKDSRMLIMQNTIITNIGGFWGEWLILMCSWIKIALSIVFFLILLVWSKKRSASLLACKCPTSLSEYCGWMVQPINMSLPARIEFGWVVTILFPFFLNDHVDIEISDFFLV